MVVDPNAGIESDTVISGLIDLNTTAGHVLLCEGGCTTSDTPTVVEAMSYWKVSANKLT